MQKIGITSEKPIKLRQLFTANGQITDSWKTLLASFVTANGIDTTSSTYKALLVELERVLRIMEKGALLGELKSKVDQSQISEHGFDEAIYQQLLFFTLIADFVEGRWNAYFNAYKLAVMFGETKSALNYLDQYITQYGGENPINDACAFNMPEDDQWDEDAWQKLCRKYLIKAEIRNSAAIVNASKINLREIITETAKRYPGLSIDKLTAPDSNSGKEILETINKRVINIRYARSDEDELAAAVFAKCQVLDQYIPEKSFNKYLDDVKPYLRTEPNDIPELFIDGKDFGCEGYYVMRLSDDDPKGAALGFLTACCQSLGREGENCALYGMTSKHAGFYVICRGKPPKDGDTKNILPQNIVAQSFAWMSNKNTIVLDSLERQPLADQVKLAKLTAALAYTLVEKKHISQVNIGIGGRTPKILAYDLTGTPEVPIDYLGYSDARVQSRISSNTSTFYARLICKPEETIEAYYKMDEDEQNKYDIAKIFDTLIPFANTTILQRIIDLEPDRRKYITELIARSAIKFAKIEFFEVCLKNNSDLYDKKFGGGNTLLTYSMFYYQDTNLEYTLSLTKLLIDKMSNIMIEQPNMFGVNALHYAAAKGNIEIVNLLLSKMSVAAVAKTNTSGNTALHEAVSNGHVDVANILLNKMDETLIAKPNKKGSTALHEACRLGLVDLAKLLITKMSHTAIMQEDNSGNTALQLAVANGNMDIVKIILESMTHDELMIKNNGLRALDMASRHNHVDGFKLILEKIGADALKQTGCGLTLLFNAAANGNTEIAEIVLSIVGPSLLMSTNSENNTLLHVAASHGRANFVRTLLEKMPIEAIERANNKGDTALHCAAEKGKGEVVRLLVDKLGPSGIMKVNRSNNTALHVAARNGDYNTIKSLIDHMTDEQIEQVGEYECTALHNLACGGFTESARLIVQRMSQSAIEKPGEISRTALHMAVLGNHVEIVKLLIETMSPEALILKDAASQRTALHDAVDQNNVKITQLLLEKISPDNIELDTRAFIRAANSNHFLAGEIIKSIAVCSADDNLLEVKKKIFLWIKNQVTPLQNKQIKENSEQMKYLYEKVKEIRKTDLSTLDLFAIVSDFQAKSSGKTQSKVGFWQKASAQDETDLQALLDVLAEGLKFGA